MRLKYYLRGFGTGVLVATIILMIAFEIHDNSKASKGEEAVTTEDVLKNDESNTTSDDTTSPTMEHSIEGASEDTSDTTDNESQVTTQENTTVQESTTGQEHTTVQESTTAQEHTTVQESTTSQGDNGTQTGNAIEPNGQTVTLIITSGMISNKAADILEELGAVSDGEDLNWYLHNNGYSNKLRVGEFQIPVGASYEEIAKIITGRK